MLNCHHDGCQKPVVAVCHNYPGDPDYAQPMCQIHADEHRAALHAVVDLK